MARCMHIRYTGQRCKMTARKGEAVCFIHSHLDHLWNGRTRCRGLTPCGNRCQMEAKKDGLCHTHYRDRPTDRRTDPIYKEKHKMAMSTDRIQLIPGAISGTERMIQEVAIAFGISQGRARRVVHDMEMIICRPSQFARFTVNLMDAGVHRAFSSDACVRRFEPENEKFDVSSNPRSI